jgi:hypothetical protein
MDETKTINGEGSAGLSIKGNYPEKDGVPSGRLTKETITTGGESLRNPLCRLAVEF